MLFDKIEFPDEDVILDINKSSEVDTVDEQCVDNEIKIYGDIRRMNEEYIIGSFSHEKTKDKSLAVTSIMDYMKTYSTIVKAIADKNDYIVRAVISKEDDKIKKLIQSVDIDIMDSKAKDYNFFLGYKFTFNNNAHIKIISLCENIISNDMKYVQSGLNEKIVRKVKDDKKKFIKNIRNMMVNNSDLDFDMEREDFNDNLFTIYRNGEINRTSVLIENRPSDLIYAEYDKFKSDVLNPTTNMYKSIESYIKSILLFTSEVLRVMDRMDDTNEDYSLFISFVNERLSYYQKLLTVINKAFSNRVAAISDYRKQAYDMVTMFVSGDTQQLPVSENYSYNFIKELSILEEEWNDICDINMITEGRTILDHNYDFNKLSEADAKNKKRISGAIDKLLEKIQEMWKAFKNKVKLLIKGDSEFLKQKKDIITGANLGYIEEIKLYPYWDGYSKLRSSTIPVFNASSVQFMDSLESEETFRKTHFKEYLDKEGNITDTAKMIFRGNVEEKKSFTGQQIQSRLSYMYDFCAKYETNVNTLDESMKKIESIGNKVKTMSKALDESSLYLDVEQTVLSELLHIDAENMFERHKNIAIESILELPEDSIRMQILNAIKHHDYDVALSKLSGMEKTDKVDLCESDIYTMLNSQYTYNKIVQGISISEAKKPKKVKPEANTTTSTDTASEGEKDTNSSTTIVVKDEGEKDTSDNSTDGETGGIDTSKNNSDRYRLYIKESYAFLACKMNILEETYSVYMKIFKAIVQNEKK